MRSKIRILLDLAHSGRLWDALALLTDALKRALWSEHRSLILSRDIVRAAVSMKTPVAFHVRPFDASDLSLLNGAPISTNDATERSLRLYWIEKALPGCFVATLDDGSPCFMQWLLRAKDNSQIKAIFGRALPQLDEHTVLLEGAYTPPRYRRIPLMPAAMERIAMLGREYGARRAIVIIGADNTSMIKAARLAGFEPIGEKVQMRRLLIQTVRYGNLPQTIDTGNVRRFGSRTA